MSSGGAMVTLEDGSIWEINSLDRIDTSLWLPVTDYRYTLINTEDGEKALAKYISSR